MAKIDLNPIDAVTKGPGELLHSAEGVASDVGSDLKSIASDPLPGKDKGPLPGMGGAVDDSSDPAKVAPADPMISTKGLKEGSNYTYKNGKLTEYQAPPEQTNYGFDPLSMQLIFSKAVEPYLNSLNKQYSQDTSGLDKAFGSDIANDKAVGVSPAATDILQTAHTEDQGVQAQNLTAQEGGAVAGAPLDALITQLGQASDAARLAGYEAEYGQATNSASSGTTSVADIVNNAINAATAAGS